jgi:hypothetical protein
MDSIISAFSRVDKDEILSLQISLIPLDESRQKKIREESEKEKNNKD